ncbi:MAG: host attachment protein [Paracoccaceae bacterium]
MAMLTKGTWVVVADSERAMILENVGHARTPLLRQIDRFESTEVAKAGARSGKAFDQGKDQRTAVEPPDHLRLGAEALAAVLVAHLLKKLAKGAFDALVIAAPPQVLGAIRDQMDETLRAHVVAEMHKTLTKHPMHKIAELVSEELGKG